MAKNKNKSREDLAFPVAAIPSLTQPAKPPDNPKVMKKIIQSSIKGAYELRTPSEPGPYSADYGKKQKPLISDDEIQLVTHLIESLQPADAIEAALASQFAIVYIRGLKQSSSAYNKIHDVIDMFAFTHQVLEALQKFRSKGAQQIQVNYNHNQGQINNIRVVESENQPETIEVKDEL